jgi:hypothetical protein
MTWLCLCVSLCVLEVSNCKLGQRTLNPTPACQAGWIDGPDRIVAVLQTMEWSVSLKERGITPVANIANELRTLDRQSIQTSRRTGDTCGKLLVFQVTEGSCYQLCIDQHEKE